MSLQNCVGEVILKIHNTKIGISLLQIKVWKRVIIGSRPDLKSGGLLKGLWVRVPPLPFLLIVLVEYANW